jgi:hypothetical protein
MNFTRNMLRALAVGVDRLNDGDLRDRAAADDVVADLEQFGYVYQRPGSFLSRNALFVNGSMHPEGVWAKDTTDTEKAWVIRELGALDAELNTLIDECRYLELPKGLIQMMAKLLREVRLKKGLRFEPADLE